MFTSSQISKRALIKLTSNCICRCRVSKTANGLLYQKECNIVGEICEDNFAKGLKI